VDTTNPCVNKVEVFLLDKKGEHTGQVSTIEFACCSLQNTEAERILRENVTTLCPRSLNDIRAVPEGFMVASGARACDGDIIDYKHTHPHQARLCATMGNFFMKRGFGHRVNALRECLVQAGHRSQSPTLGKHPWFTLTVCMSDHGNENHVDPKDAGAQCMTIWHKKGKVSNWYFLFPDVRIFVDGRIRKGLAIPLHHGTVVSWDGRYMRHCTAKPKLEGKNARVHGTYFGAQQQVLDVAKKYPKYRQRADSDRPRTEQEYRQTKHARTK
jgi:hypothetical protein